MFKSLLLSLWHRLKPKKNIAQANEVEAIEFRKFYQKELVETCRALGYDIQFGEDDCPKRMDR